MSGASTFLLFVRVGFSLAVVLAMIWGVARFARRRGSLPSRGSDPHLEVVARRTLGRRGSLVVVETAGHTLLVGVTDASIALVADLSDGPRTAAPALVVGEGTGLETPAEAVVADLRVADLRGTERLGTDSRGGPRRDSLMDALRDMTVRRI